jgi:tRNA(adenine34) deaminase
MNEDERWMESAIREAEQAARRNEVPVGAVIVHEGRIIGRGYNQIETLQDPTAHAEMIAITAGATALGNRRLEGCTLYVTLEPCTMCAGAIVLARIPRLVFGAPDPKAGACGSLALVVQDPRLNHRVELSRGVLEERCSLEGVLLASPERRGRAFLPPRHHPFPPRGELRHQRSGSALSRSARSAIFNCSISSSRRPSITSARL